MLSHVPASSFHHPTLPPSKSNLACKLEPDGLISISAKRPNSMTVSILNSIPLVARKLHLLPSLDSFETRRSLPRHSASLHRQPQVLNISTSIRTPRRFLNCPLQENSTNSSRLVDRSTFKALERTPIGRGNVSAGRLSRYVVDVVEGQTIDAGCMVMLKVWPPESSRCWKHVNYSVSGTVSSLFSTTTSTRHECLLTYLLVKTPISSYLLNASSSLSTIPLSR